MNSTFPRYATADVDRLSLSLSRHLTFSPLVQDHADYVAPEEDDASGDGMTAGEVILIKRSVRQLVGLQLLSQTRQTISTLSSGPEAVEAKDLAMLQALKMIDPKDTTMLDTTWTKFLKSASKTFASAAGAQSMTNAINAMTCAATAYSGSVSPACMQLLSDLATGFNARKGSPATALVRSKMEWTEELMKEVKMQIEACEGANVPIPKIVSITVSQVVCMLTMLDAYFEYRRFPNQGMVVDGVEYKYKINLARPAKGFSGVSLKPYKDNEEMDMVGEILAEMRTNREMLQTSLMTLEIALETKQMNENQMSGTSSKGLARPMGAMRARSTTIPMPVTPTSTPTSTQTSSPRATPASGSFRSTG